MQPFNIFETGGREKFLKKRKDKKTKTQTQSKQHSQIITIQKHIRTFLQLKSYYQHEDNKIEQQNEPIHQKQSKQLFSYWLLNKQRVQLHSQQYKIIKFFLMIQSKINNSQDQVYFGEHKILITRMVELFVQFLKELFVISPKESVKIMEMIVTMFNKSVLAQCIIDQDLVRKVFCKLRTIDGIKQQQQMRRLSLLLIDSVLLSNEQAAIKIMADNQYVLIEYLLSKQDILKKSQLLNIVSKSYWGVLQTRQKNKLNPNHKDLYTVQKQDNQLITQQQYERFSRLYNTILKQVSTVTSNSKQQQNQLYQKLTNNPINQYDQTIMLCFLWYLGSRMKAYQIQAILNKYKIDRRIFDNNNQYQQYLQEKDQYLMWRQDMMGQYQSSKQLIKTQLQRMLCVQKQQKAIISGNFNEGSNKSKLAQLAVQTSSEYIYQLLQVLGDVQILPLDKAITLFVETVNESTIYNLGKQSSNLTPNLSTQTYSTSTNFITPSRFLLLLTLIEKSVLQTTDLHFIKLFQSQQQKDTLKRLIKQYLLKILKHLMFLSNPTAMTSKIITVTTTILENLYNKIFRTNLVPTQIFQNTSFIMKFKAYSFKAGSKDEVSQFLIQFPYVFPLSIRADKFKQILHYERLKFRQQIFHLNFQQNQNYIYGKHIRIRRNHQFEDAFYQLKQRDLRRPFRVTFINLLGFQEKGIDAGGLKKQFLNRVLKDALNPKNGMFIENSNHELLPHPTKAQLNEGLYAQHYEFIGKLIGLAIYENITLGYKFSGTFLNAIVGKKNCFDDLRTIDPSLYKSLIYIKDMKQDAKQLELTFLYQDEARNKLIQLLPNGHLVPVTNENKRLYISLLTSYKVNKSLEHQTRFIRKGLTSIISKEWLFIFNYEQLNYLISGQGKINIDDLRYYSKIIGFEQDSLTIKYFWQVVRQFDQQQKSKLLMFVTSCPRPSFLGFKQLSPPFTITCMKDKEHLLPISHTCSNVLELPQYKTKEDLKKKLLTAIESNCGFQFG